MDRGLCPVGGGKYGPSSRAGVALSHPTSIAPGRREWRYGVARLALGMATAADGYGAKGRTDWANGVGSACHHYPNVV